MVSTEQYAVWCPDMGEEEREDERLIKAYDAEAAAKRYVEDSYHDEAFDCEMIVKTRGPYGERITFGVTPEPTTYFASRQIGPAS